MLALNRIRGTGRTGLPNASAKMFAAAAMMAVANLALLRKLGYFADYANVATVLGAWVIGQAIAGARWRPATAALPITATGVVLLVSVSAAITYVPPVNVVAMSGLNDGLRGAWDKGVRSLAAYTTSPPIDEYAPPGSTGDRGLLRYIYECTRSDDRIWQLTDIWTLPYYTERRVVGHPFWERGFLATPESQRRTIERVDEEEVPLIVSFGTRPLEHLESYDLVHEYVSQRYTEHLAVPEDNTGRGRSIWLLTDSRRTPTGTYELLGLPCFK